MRPSTSALYNVKKLNFNLNNHNPELIRESLDERVELQRKIIE